MLHIPLTVYIKTNVYILDKKERYGDTCQTELPQPLVTLGYTLKYRIWNIEYDSIVIYIGKLERARVLWNQAAAVHRTVYLHPPPPSTAIKGNFRGHRPPQKLLKMSPTGRCRISRTFSALERGRWSVFGNGSCCKSTVYTRCRRKRPGLPPFVADVFLLWPVRCARAERIRLIPET